MNVVLEACEVQYDEAEHALLHIRVLLFACGRLLNDTLEYQACLGLLGHIISNERKIDTPEKSSQQGAVDTVMRGVTSEGEERRHRQLLGGAQGRRLVLRRRSN